MLNNKPQKAKTPTEARVLKTVCILDALQFIVCLPRTRNHNTTLSLRVHTVSPMHCELHALGFLADHQKERPKLLREWDNTAHCPVAKTEDYKVIVSLLTRANQVATRYIS